jgi:molybdopterin molybdotransferase
MDGYAVRAADLPGTLRVSQRIPAGAPAAPLESGTVARVFTGAVLPPGADAVVMQEDVSVPSGEAIEATFGQPATVGQHIRRRGSDIMAGLTVLEPGRVLQPQDLALLAATGAPQVEVYRRLRVAIFSTGDELVPPGKVPKDWQIFNSNSVQLATQIQALGCEPILLETQGDNSAEIGEALRHAATVADCIVTSGGVSVGEEDHVRAQIEQHGELTLWKLAIKPGKPVAYGHIQGCPIFGLPGNPVSTWVTFGLVVKPWLLAAQGAVVSKHRRLACRADFERPVAGSREEYLRVVLSAGGNIAALAGDQSSGVLSSVGRADGLAIIPPGQTLRVGDPVDVVMITEFLSPHAAG